MPVSPVLDVINATRTRYSKFVSDGILQDYPFFKELQKANGAPRSYAGTIGGEGGIIKNVGGNDTFTWDVMTAQMPSGGWGPGSTITLTTPNILIQPTLTMGGYWVGYSIRKWETMSLGTNEEVIPIIKLWEQMATRRWYTLFNVKCYLNENALNPRGWGGLALFMTNTGTYAGSVDLSQSYATPALFDYSASGQSFTVTCLDRITQVINNATVGDSQGGSDAPTTMFLNRNNWQQVKNVMEDSRHIVDTDIDMLKLGFKQWMYNGLRGYWDDAMSAQSINKVYILNMHHLGVAHATNSLMHSMEGETTEGTLAKLYVTVSKSQFFCSNTRKQGYIDNTTSS